MRVLIFGETPEAESILTSEREAGHKASLRNPEFFDGTIPVCDKAVCWDGNIAQTLIEAGVNVEYLGVTTDAPADDPVAAEVETETEADADSAGVSESDSEVEKPKKGRGSK